MTACFLQYHSDMLPNITKIAERLNDYTYVVKSMEMKSNSKPEQMEISEKTERRKPEFSKIISRKCRQI